MAALLNQGELEIWIRSAIASEASDWAAAVMAAASDVVRTEARQPTWTRATAPMRARQITCHLAARSFLNPDSTLAEGNVGPLGGDRMVEELARALHLTVAEVAELQLLRPLDTAPGGGGLWIQPITAGLPIYEADIFLEVEGTEAAIPYGHFDDEWAFTPVED